MKILFSITFLLLCLLSQAQTIVTTDIDNFWTAYDKIKATKNKAKQFEYINTLFIAKGTPGLKAIMQVRQYSDTSYIEAINNYPKFWKSVRANTLKANEFAKAIDADIAKIKNIYPDLKPAGIYFTIGALRTNGTTLDSMVLIGSELAFGDSETETGELANTYSHLLPFFKSNSTTNIVFLNVHEYVHTQQKTTICNTLAAQCIMEGVAEFVAVTATGKPSPTPAIQYGRDNAAYVRTVFEEQMFNPFEGFWLYSNATNPFAMRDLGYYIGYAVCESYYNNATDKKAAIKYMIELDYNDEAALLKFAEASGYFSIPMANLKELYEKNRPTVVDYTMHTDTSIRGININKKILTIQFSERIDPNYRNFEYGPLGEEYVLPLLSFEGYSEDFTSASFKIHYDPTKHYQIMVGSGFRNVKGIALKPYLIDIPGAEK